MVRLGVSPKVLSVLKKLLKSTNKPVPLIKYKIPKKLRPGDIISLKSTPTSARVRVVSIREFEIGKDAVPYDELKAIYNDAQLKAIFTNKKLKKVYLIYVKPVN